MSWGASRHSGQVGDALSAHRCRLAAVLACFDLRRLAAVHCFLVALLKPGRGSVGSVTRFPPVGSWVCYRVFQAVVMSKLLEVS